MDIRTRENSIRVLKQILDAHQGQLDTSVILEIEGLIAELESERSGHSQNSDTERRWRTLKVIAEVLNILTNLSNLMR